jgi:GT2 family glycosyltransferase
VPIVGLLDSPEIVAIVPTMLDKPRRVEKCLSSLAAGTGKHRLAVLCVVNSSTADPRSVKLHGATAEVVGLNLGWPGGLAFGIGRSTAPLIWFVQDDMVVLPDTLSELVAALGDDEGLGLVGPLVVDEHGMVPAGSCGGRISDDGAIIGWAPATACRPEELTDLESLSYVPSRGMLVRRIALERTAGPNARLYPLQYVDADLCYQLRRAGYALRLVPSARVQHLAGGATSAGYARFLQSRNAQAFSHAWFEDRPSPPEKYFAVYWARPDAVEAARHPIHPELPRELLDAVAQSAADTLTHLGRVFTAELDARSYDQVTILEGELDAALTRIRELESSTSWRITAPLRTILGRARQARIRPKT